MNFNKADTSWFDPAIIAQLEAGDNAARNKQNIMVSTSDINEDYLTFLLNQTALSKQEACNYLIANDGNLTLAVQKFITDFPQLNLYRSKYNTLGP